MKHQPAIKAIIFDMDGVLVDMKDWHYGPPKHALGLFGLHISKHAHASCYEGLPPRRKLEMRSADSGLPRELHGCINGMKRIYTLDMLRKARLAPYLEASSSNEDVARGKPNPEIYRKAIAHFDLACGAHVMVVREVGETDLDNILAHIARIGHPRGNERLPQRFTPVQDGQVQARPPASCLP